MNIPRWMQAISRDQDGIILPLVLVFLAVGLLLLAPTLGHGYSAIAGTSVTESRAEELHAADSGIEEAIYWITRHQPGKYEWNEDEGRWERTNPYLLNSKIVDVTITPEPGDDEHLYRIVSRAEDPDSEGSSTVLALVFAVPFAEYIEGDENINSSHSGDLVVDGNLTVSQGQTTIDGNVTVHGNLEMGQSTSIQGSVTSTGDVTLGQVAHIEGDALCVGGDLHLGQGAELVAEVHMLNEEGSTIYIGQGNHDAITGDIFSEGDLTVHISQNAYIIGNIYSKGTVHLQFDGPQASMSGIVYHCETPYATAGHRNASFPSSQYCPACDCVIEPEFDCDLLSPNQAQILEWEIT